HARHILLKTEEDAKAAIKKLDGGADFAALAKELSTGPSKDNGGDLGFFVKEQMVPEFAEATFAMKPGSYSKKPVQTQFGWHVIKVEEARKRTPPTLEEATPVIRQELSREVGLAYLEEVKKDAKIEKFNPDGSPKQ
ncbi:MAG: peptidylprolyl isomerase, partial [Rhodospirillales bacterium]